jgi:endogenous inhibitor of DNA gyrase (YacG/DUF329 family)
MNQMKCFICTNLAQWIEDTPKQLPFCSKECQLINGKTYRKKGDVMEYGDKKKKKIEIENFEYANSIAFLHRDQLQEISFPVDDREFLKLTPASPYSDHFPGYDVKAVQAIPANTVIGYFAGYYKHPNMCADNEHTFRVSDMVIDASSRGNLTRFISHSQFPNVEVFEDEVGGFKVVGFRTNKDIREGDTIHFTRGQNPERDFSVVTQGFPIRFMNPQRIENDIKFTCVIRGEGKYTIGIWAAGIKPIAFKKDKTVYGVGGEEEEIKIFQNIDKIEKITVHVLLSKNIIAFECEGQIEPFQIPSEKKYYKLISCSGEDTAIKVF